MKTLDQIKNIRIEDFDYPLPEERIAKHPLAERDACKLLVSNAGDISHHVFSELPDLIPAGTILVMNNTRVINARMEFFRASGARIEIFLLEPIMPRDYAVAFQTRHRCSWQCMVGNLKKWKDEWLEKQIVIDGKEINLRAIRRNPLPGNSHEVEFEWSDPEVTFASIVEAAGAIPIPPYLNRKSEESDSIDYQTVYSRVRGSVAAPTAGLHFTPELLDRLRAKGVETREVTLHVGAGTFQPVKSDDIGGHPMHTEVFEVEKSLVRTLREALESGRKIMAIGTTTVRTLESLPILGFQIMNGNESLKVSQWEAYQTLSPKAPRPPEGGVLSMETYSPPSGGRGAATTLRALEEYMERMGEERLTASTAIMIAPGFQWRIVSGMVTNFHQPQSTLLLLVSSLLDGDNLENPLWKKIYKEALDNDYRFLSYGDACLFMNAQCTMHNAQSKSGQVKLPGSKSIAARALVCRLLSGHDTRLGNLPECGDTDGMLRLTEAVRAAQKSGEPVRVDIGEGGTTLRFGMAACASIPGLDITLTGSPRLMARPHTTLIQALESMGAEITPLPEENAIHIKGHLLKGGEIELDGSVSSQYLSAMMLAAPTWEKDTLFLLKKPVVSYPYISMTAGVMREFGGKASIEENEEDLEVSVKNHGYAQCARYDVEGDWSAASYFYEAKLISMHNAQCTMHNQLRDSVKILNSQFSILNSQFLKAPAESLQGDSRVAEIFAEAEKRVGSGEYGAGNKMTLNLNDAPDLVPAIAVGFCLAGLHFRIEGVAHLRHKESDRMAALQCELRKLGYELSCGDDTMEWNGERCEADPNPNPNIKTYQDHRMAMAFAPAKMIYPNLVIENPEVVVKSFPNFWQEISKVMHNSQCTMHNQHRDSPEIQNSKFKIQN